MATFKNSVYRAFNKFLPKFNRVLIVGNDKLESNAIEVANYISLHYKLPVYFAVAEQFKSYAEPLLLPEIKKINLFGKYFKILNLTSKYIFSTHGSSLAGSSKKQTEVNIWHGVGHKRIRLLRGEPGIQADITVATSDLTKRMFSECFGVPLESVFISGYPRNDLMLRSQRNRLSLKEKLDPFVNQYDKILFWMPTFRRKPSDENWNKLELDNPFQVDNFDVISFNELLKEQNAICLLKPHYFYMTGNTSLQGLSNILMIDDEWIHRQGISLYQFLACTDVMITDFSSVMIDYTLLDQPVICLCTDLEDYKNTQGLYFEDIENWIPTQLIQNQEDFFTFLRNLLLTGEDPYKGKSREIRKKFFSFNDANSTQRLVEHVFSDKVKKTSTSKSTSMQ